jgi:hypothetical protein
MKAIIFVILFFSLFCCSAQQHVPSLFKKEIANTLRNHILKEAEWALQQIPVTVTAASSRRSAGGKHDFFSEGDYWWPDPGSIDSPYIRKDGMTNSDNFVAHRHAMIRFSRIVGALALHTGLPAKISMCVPRYPIAKHGSLIHPP